MASVMNVKEEKVFCDDVYTELTDIKGRITRLAGRTTAKSPGMDVDGGLFRRHLNELADQIEWKLQILAHSCSVDWRGALDFAEEAQVSTLEKSGDVNFSPGYVGG